MAFPFAIPIAATIGGYAVDKMMGGNGMTGAGLGFSAGTMGADGGKGATAGAANTIPAHLISKAPTVAGAVGGTAATTGSAALGSGMGAQLGSGVGGYSTGTSLIPAVENELTKAAANSIGSDPNMMFNPESGNFLSKEYFVPAEESLFKMPSMDMPSIDGILDTGKEYAGQAYDYVADGLDDMSFVDQASLGLTGYQALGQKDPTMQRVTNGEMLQSQYQNPKDGLLDISVEGTTGSKMTQNELTPEQLKILGLL